MFTCPFILILLSENVRKCANSFRNGPHNKTPSPLSRVDNVVNGWQCEKS